MATFDTNVVLRVLYLDDDVEQAERAGRAWRTELAGEGAHVPTIVLVEVAWVLTRRAKADRSAVARVLRTLCDTEGVTIEHEDRVRRALIRYAAGPADFSDYLILEAARDAGALPVITFDERFVREAEVEVPRAGEP